MKDKQTLQYVSYHELIRQSERFKSFVTKMESYETF